jgi:hypothetical protein
MFFIGPPFSSLAIIKLHALSLFQKTVQIRNKFFLYMDPNCLDCSVYSAKNNEWEEYYRGNAEQGVERLRELERGVPR